MTQPKRVLLAILLAVSTSAAQAGILFSDSTGLPAGTSPSAVAAADLTGDSHLDLIVVNRVSDDAYVYIGDGSGGFQFFQSFSVGAFPQGVATADFDGDLEADIATTAVPFNSGTVSAWPGTGDGTFQSPLVLTADDGTRSVEVADIDNNGLLDIVVTNPTRDNISTFLGNGDGTFGAEIRTTVGGIGAFPTDLAIADFDGDGNADVVTSNAQSGNDRPQSVVAGDFDRDGRMDVAVACFVSSDAAVMLGDGNGGFAAPQLYSLLPDEANPYWILTEDFDNDGKADLVTANNGGFSVLRGNGDGTFEPPIGVESQPGTFFGALAADFDEDGWPDLAFANMGQDEVTVFLNTTALCAGAPCPPYLDADSPSTLSWSSVADALGYDVIRGSLQLLIASGGNFTAATTDCVAGLTPLTSYTETDPLGAGAGFWYLVRVVTAAGATSYDVHSGNLDDARDTEIAASGVDCP